MFCSSCGQSSAPNALFCHKCGKKLNAVEAAAYPQPAKAQLGSASSRPSGSGVKTEKSLTFKQFQSRKREDRSSHFTKKGKKPKLDDDTEVKINVGIMATKAGALATKRGLTLPLTVRQGITSEELLQKAVEKHSRFNNDVIKSSNKATYKILYGDKSVVTKLPGSEEAFTLRRYKEEIDKPYSRITFYLCTNSDYLESLCSTFDFESDSDESYQGDPQEKVTENTKSEQEVEESPKQQKSALLDQDQHADWMSAPVVVLDRPSSSKAPVVVLDRPSSSKAPVVLLDHPYSSKEKEAQCPICCLNFSVSQIEEHADTCSSWLIESEQPFDLISTNAVEDKAMTNLAKDPFENKILLKEQIAQLVSGSVTEYTRVTLRRKFIWNDFKAARHSKIQPNSNLKVVFVGEPCIDDGGPKRELFTELMAIMQLKFFKNGFPVSSSVALSNGDFQLCGEIMAMSILQGGPGPNFMAAQVVSYLVGKPLSTDKNKQHQLKTVADSLVNASSDEEVRELLTSEGVLDVLEEIGYTGIPQKETLFSVKEIVQSICMKDQLTEQLPALLQIQNGLQVCGLLKCIKSHPDVWQPVFESNTAFAITADEFLDQLDVKYSASQIKKDPEIDTFKFFCDTIEKIDAEIGDLELRDIIKWLTGSYDIPPLGFPKKFQVEFVHGCLPGCCCRPTASTCDITIKLPVHINSPKIMEEMIYSSIKESHGFGLL